MSRLELFFWCALFTAGLLLLANVDFIAGVIAR